MTSKMIALRVLDSIIVVGTGGLILSIAGLPMDWLSRALDMSIGEFRAFAIFMVFAALRLMHAIASSDLGAVMLQAVRAPGSGCRRRAR